MENVDAASAALILSLQLDDVNDAIAVRTVGANPAHVMDDHHVALALLREDLRSANPRAQAVAGDHQHMDEASDPTETSDTETAATGQTNVGSSSQIECISCLEQSPELDVLRLACGHHFCVECIRNVFSLSTRDGSAFPPRCCRQSIPLRTAYRHLDFDNMILYLRKEMENATEDRTYCAHPPCSTFIPTVNNGGTVAVCSDCRQRTCITCKGKNHEGICPVEENTQRLRQLADRQGWRACFRCGNMVELSTGCNHITYVIFIESFLFQSLPSY